MVQSFKKSCAWLRRYAGPDGRTNGTEFYDIAFSAESEKQSLDPPMALTVGEYRGVVGPPGEVCFGPLTKEGKGPTNSLPSVRSFVRPELLERTAH